MSHANGSTPTLSLRQSVTDYMKLAGLSERTRKSYLLELDRFARHFAGSPAQLSARQIEGYVLERINAGLRPRSTNLTVAALRMLYRQVLHSPQKVESLAMRKIADQLPRTLSESDIQRLILSTHDLRYRTAIELAYGTGLRIGEVVALKVSDIDSDRAMIRVNCGKGGHERLVYMPPSLLSTLRCYYRQIHPKPVEWLFYGASADQPLKAATLRGAFNRARALAGIGENVTFHSLRHSIATHLLERGTQRDVVQDILGHKSARSTRVYARTTSAMFEKLDHPAQYLSH